MVSEFVRGKHERFMATISFSLNWDDKSLRSVKVFKDQEVLYDGEIAVVGEGPGQIAGRCMGLRSAINVMRWLKPVKKQEKKNKSQTVINNSSNDYDPKIGGNFDTYMKDSGIATPVVKREIIKEEELIVKEIPSLKKEKKEIRNGKKLEIAGDQVEVKEIPKERLLVSSSTVVSTKKERLPVIIPADEMNSDSVIPLKNVKQPVKSEKKKKSFIVDNSTPRQIRDDMTKEEVDRITKVVQVDDSQSATVVKNIKPTNEVKEVEGIVLRKIKSPSEMTPIKTTADGLTITTKVSSGANSPVGNQGAVVVGVSKTAKKTSAVDIEEEPPELTEEEKRAKEAKKIENEKKAKERALARKRASVKTQKEMEKEKKKELKEEEITSALFPEENIIENDITIPEDRDSKDIPSIADPVTEESLNKESVESTDYLLLLPENWGKLHWVKKEKFIRGIYDINFIRFILSLESVKAVKNACLERLEELGQKEPS